jgi:hypothetical protein
MAHSGVDAVAGTSDAAPGRRRLAELLPVCRPTAQNSEEALTELNECIGLWVLKKSVLIS